MTAYERIKGLTEARGMTGKQLAEVMGLKKTPLTDWKNEQSKPTLDQIQFLCDYFGVSSDYLLGNTDDPEPPGSDSHLKFALFGDREIDDEVLEDVRQFAEFVKQKKKEKRSG
jgi:transcriptional regulator with XRE-family HTH domain